MNTKYILILFLCLFLSLGAVNASDLNDTQNNDLLVESQNADYMNDDIFYVITAYEDTNNTLTANEDEGYFIDVTEAYVLLNEFRAEKGVWYWAENNVDKVVYNTNANNALKPLEIDDALEQSAQIRAKELVERFDHVRPDGSWFYTAYPTDKLVNWGWNENAAWNYRSCKSVIEGWKESNDQYEKQGHRRTMLSPEYNAVGIACYKINGEYWWIQAFGQYPSLSSIKTTRTSLSYSYDSYNSVTLTAYVIPAGAGGKVTFKVNGNSYTGTIKDSYATYKLTDLSPGTYSVEAIYNGDSSHKSSSSSLTFSNTKFIIDDIKLTANDLTKTYGGSENFTVSLSINNEPTDGVDIIININGKEYIKTTDINGKVSLPIDLDCGTYDAFVTYDEVSTKAKITVNKAATTTKITYKENAYNNITLTATVSPTATGKVTFNVNGKTYTQTIKNSKATLKLTNLDNGDYTVKATYGGDTNHKTSSSTIKFTINEIKITANDITKKYGESKNFTATITKCDLALADANVKININGVDYTKLSDSEGKVFLPIDLNSGTYTATVSYGNISTTAKITVNKLTTKTTSSWVQNSQNNVTLTATVSPTTANGKVTFNVNGKTYTGTINNSKATLTLTNLNIGNYTVTITYNGDTNHKQSNSTLKFTIEKISLTAQDLTKNYGESDNFVVTLIKGDSPLAKASIKITINGVDYTKTTNNKGKINLPVDLNVGTYDAVVSYGDISKTAKITVNKVSTKVSYSTSKDSSGNEFINVNILPATATGKVTLDFNGKTFTKTLKDSKASLNLNEAPSGNYTVKITYKGDSNHKSSSITTFEISVSQFKISAQNLTLNYGESKNFTATLTKDDSPVANAEVNIEIRNNSYVKTTDKSGKVFIPVDLDSGEYTVTVSYKNILTTAKITVNKIKTNTELTLTQKSRNSVTLTATVSPTATGKVTFNVNGKSYSKNIKNSKATLTLTNLTSGSYTVKATYNGAANYAKSSGNINFEIAEINIKTQNLTLNYGETKDLTATLTQGSFKIANENVKISINGVDYTKTTDKNGKITLAINNLDSGTYDAVVSFENKSETAKVTVNKLTTKTDLKYTENSYNNITLTAAVTPEATGKVTFDVNGKTYTQTIKDSKATLKLTELDSGNYTAKATYKGDTNHKTSTSTIQFTIDEITVKAQDLTLNYGESKDFTATLTQGNSPIANEKVKITINNKDYTKTTDKNGKITLSINNLESGTYDAVVSYGNISKTAKITVNKLTTKTDLIYTENSYNNITLTAAVTPEATGKVTFDVNGKTYTQTIKDSKATLKLTELDSGNYTAKATYKGDTNHKTSTSTIQFTIDKITIKAQDLTFNYGEARNFTATVTKGNSPLANVIVKINIGDSKYSRLTDNAGKISVLLNILDSGTYDAVVSYGDISATAKITVNKLSTKTSLSYVQDSYDGVTLTATITPTANGKVTFDVNGKTYEGYTQFSKVSVKVTNLTEGEYKVKANFNGYNNYKSSSDTIRFTIDETFLNVQDLTKTYGESDDFVVVLSNNNTPIRNAEIKININGINYIKTTDNEGKVIIPIDLDSGVYDAVVTYKDITKTSKITINKIKTQIYTFGYNRMSHNSVKLTTTITPYIPSGEVIFSENGKNYTCSIIDSKASLILSDLAPGQHSFSVVYPGDVNHESSNATRQINFTSSEYEMYLSVKNVTKYYKGDERLNIRLYDNDLKYFPNCTIKITINGNTYTRITDEKGMASMAINLGSGIYNVTTEYNDMKTYSTVTVLPTINGSDVVKIFRNATQYYATFRNSTGELLKNTEVKFNINGVFYTRPTNENGTARLNINLNPGTYIITAENPENGEMYSNNITVLSRIVENSDLVKYFRNDSQYVIKVLDEKGNPAKEGETVRFNINGVFYERAANATGHVKLNINLAPGDYIITAEYNDCRVSNNIKVLPVLSADNFTKKYGEKGAFEVKLVDGEGKAFANQTITFNINGVFYERITDENGTAHLNINLMAGEYIITSTYNNGSISNKVTVLS